MRSSRSASTRTTRASQSGDSGTRRETATSRRASASSQSRSKRRGRGLPLTRNRKDSKASEKDDATSPTTVKTKESRSKADIAKSSDDVQVKSESKQTDQTPEENERKPSVGKKPEESSKEAVLEAISDGEVMKVSLRIEGKVFTEADGDETPTKQGSDNPKRSSKRLMSSLGRDGNQFYCQVCKGFGNVVCCDGCPRVYHQNCIPSDNPSRQALDRDEDPWYCPECIKQKPEKESPAATGRRAVKRKCCECQQSGGNLQPCGGCGVYLHHPSCQSVSDAEITIGDVPLCSTCRAHEVEKLEMEKEENKSVDDNEEENENGDGGEAKEEEASIEEEKPVKRTRKRSIEARDEAYSEEEENSAAEEKDERERKSSRERQSTGDRSVEARPKRRASSADAQPPKKKRKNSFSANGKKKRKKGEEKKKKRKKRKDSQDLDSNQKKKGGEEVMSSTRSRLLQRGLVAATPAFFYFLNDNRLKIERVLSRKHRYFNRLPKGMERNELIAREGALWWIKLRQTEQKRYYTMSMRDFEERVIEWKEEKTIREMLMARDPEDDTDEGGMDEDGQESLSPEDESQLYNRHHRLYLATSVGSRPLAPEPGKSNNRVLLELLQDMRFHPLPMLNPLRTGGDGASTTIDNAKVTLPHFDVHGPLSTSVGDECLGCTRGWNHFCPVLKRRIPAMEHRSKLQPPLSSLMATRVGLGLKQKPFVTRASTDSVSAGRNAELFDVRDTQQAHDAKLVPQIPSLTLSEPSTRADDIVHFVEEAIAMKVPEPPRPSPPAQSKKKSGLSRGVLPTRGRKSDQSPIEHGDDSARSTVNKCGRCRTIIRGDTGCVQCRRAQLVINTSKRTGGQSSSNKPDKKSGTLKVQATMLGRLTLKDTNFEEQSEGDRNVANAIAAMRWHPDVTLPPKTTCAPIPKTRAIEYTSDSSHETEDVASQKLAEQEGSKAKEPSTASTQDVLGNSKGTAANPDPNDSNDSSSRPTRRQRSSRISAGANMLGENEGSEAPDRQQLAVEHKMEANELQQRCLSVACCGILTAMMRRDPLCLFAEPVPANVVGYSAVVPNPIDFGKIKQRVIKGKYSSLGAFVADARLLCTNALAFNHPGSIYSKTAKELYDMVDEMQKRASRWISAIKDAHAASYAWRGMSASKKRSSPVDGEGDDEDVSEEDKDPFRDLRKTWPEAVDMLENGDWLLQQVSADFMRTKENETAYYGSIAVRRAAIAAEAALAPYTDSGGIYSTVVRRSHVDDENLRRLVNNRVAKVSDPIQLKNIPTWREEAIIRILRRVQSRRVESRISSENGCARCDGIRFDQEDKMVLSAEAVRWGRNKRKGEVDTLPRVAPSRLALTTGLASSTMRSKLAGETKSKSSGDDDDKDNDDDKDKKAKSTETSDANPEEKDEWAVVNEVAASVRGSRIHGWGLFADQPFKKGDVVAEYVGEYISNAVADAREKIYQERRIQDYQFRVDENLVIDATLKGGHGRYINHNCSPSCIAKIVDGRPPNKHLKRVIIVAQRDIKEREEITYDYQFPLELDLDARIPCNCGSNDCRGFMNWDLPEKGSKNRVSRTHKRGGNMRDRIRRLGRPLKNKVE